MIKQQPLISVLCCAHNEEKYVRKSIPKILKALEGISAEILFIADRYSDKTIEIAKKYNVQIINKTWKKWKNSYAESLQTGFLQAKGKYVSIIDVDIAIPINFFHDILPFIKNPVASIAAEVITYPSTFWNRVIYAWERTYIITPFGKEPYGAARLILKKALDKIGGFKDVEAPDTNLDMDLSNIGFKSIAISDIKTYHLRNLSIGKMIKGQKNSGKARYSLGISLKRTIIHSIIRFRPLILIGWLNKRSENKLRSKKNDF